jgi:hypothetical protein
MFDQFELGSEFFEKLREVDEGIVERAAEEKCRYCGGPLHRGDYPRKPRGGVVGAAGEAFTRRYSLCCGREGCRRRATPVSVRFLGRRVYLGVTVIVTSTVALVLAAARALRLATGVAPRTARRWARWWRGPFTETSVFLELVGRLSTHVSRDRLPTSILEVLAEQDARRLAKLLGWLAPLTTSTSPMESRFLRGVM